VQIHFVYSTTLTGFNSSPHMNINIYNEGHTTVAINVAECDISLSGAASRILVVVERSSSE